MHKTPYKHRFIAGSRCCTTKPLSQLLTKCLQEIKKLQENYCKAIYNNTGINRMWILKNSASLLETLKNEDLGKVTHISTWDFSTLYITIPQKDLKDRICRLIKFAFKKNDIKYIIVSERYAYFSRTESEKEGCISWTCSEFCKVFEFLIDNIYVKFGDDIFQQTLGIPMGTDCAPVLADLFLYTYEYDFLDVLTKSKKTSSGKKVQFYIPIH